METLYRSKLGLDLAVDIYSSMTAERDVSPAEVIIQLQLPANKVIYGGFMRLDIIQDIVNLAASYFTIERLVYFPL